MIDPNTYEWRLKVALDYLGTCSERKARYREEGREDLVKHYEEKTAKMLQYIDELHLDYVKAKRK